MQPFMFLATILIIYIYILPSVPGTMGTCFRRLLAPLPPPEQGPLLPVVGVRRRPGLSAIFRAWRRRAHIAAQTRRWQRAVEVGRVRVPNFTWRRVSAVFDAWFVWAIPRRLRRSLGP